MVCPDNPSDCSTPQSRKKTLITREESATSPSPISAPPRAPLKNPLIKRGNPDLSEIIDEIVNATKAAESRLKGDGHHDIRKRQDSTSLTSTVTSTHTHSALSTLSQTTTSTEAEQTETQTATSTTTVSTSTTLATVTATGTPNGAVAGVSPTGNDAVIVASWVSLVYLTVMVLKLVKVVNN